MLLNLFTLASLAATVQLAFASPTSLVRRTNPNEPPPVVDLGYARYQGYLNETAGLYWWRGIRYASAQRFQAPQTPATHKAVRNATEYGPICWPASEGVNTTKGMPPPSNSSSSAPQKQASEDCLFLDVLAPAGSCEGANLPVLVYIHGGGYAFGDASTGSDFAAFIKHTGTKMVVVQIQYRLGPFGFLAGQAMKDYGVTNAGLLDQAGETSKALGLKKPLFQAALTSSVFLPPQVDYNVPSVEKVYARFASAVNCTDIASSFDCLAKVDAARLAAAAFANAAAAPWAVWTYVPVIDGSFLRDRASVLLSQGRAKLNGMFLTAINNADEGAIWADPTLAADSTTDPTALASQFDRLLAGLLPQLNASERQTVAEYYPISPAPSIGNTVARISAVIADSTFSCPSYWLTEAFGSSAYKGTFAISPASHGWDTFYYLGDIFGGNRSRSSVGLFDGALAGAILGSFDPNKNPVNSHLNPYWPTYDTHKEMVFNTTTTDPASPADPHVVKTSSLKRFGKDQLERCEFWRGPISLNAGL